VKNAAYGHIENSAVISWEYSTPHAGGEPLSRLHGTAIRQIPPPVSGGRPALVLLKYTASSIYFLEMNVEKTFILSFG